MKKDFCKIILILCLVGLAIIERLWWDLGPNVEFVTTATIISAIYVGRNWALIVPLLILGLTDMLMGNSQIMIFTWSAFVIEVLAVVLLSRKLGFFQKRVLSKLLISSGMGVGASLWFYLWTNFGVWLQGSWGMYPMTLGGLIACYFSGLPFLKLNLFSSLLFLPMGVFTWEVLTSFKKVKLYFISKILAKD